MSRNLRIGCALALLTFAVFWPVRHFDFINFDDNEYVTENPHVQSGLSWEGLAWAFKTTHASNWHPLTWISHMADCQIYGLKPGGHHFTNLILHIANTLLLFLVLQRLTGAPWRSAMVAGLFAWHPMHVESVAWVAERKDVLSTFFGFFAFWYYARYVEERGRLEAPKATDPANLPPESKTPSKSLNPLVFYLLAIGAYLLGLLAKPMLVTLPFIMLLLDYWPLRRSLKHQWSQLILEKLPFLLLAAASSVTTFLVQKKGGAVSNLVLLPLNARIENALFSYFRYIGKLLWPSNLCLPYPHPRFWPPGEILEAALVVLAISVVAIYLAPSLPYLLTGWLWFLGMLIPVIGLVQVGNQSLADRYTYLPYVGLFIMLVWGLEDLTSGRPWLKTPKAMAMVAVLGACLWLTSIQLGYWKNSLRLFEHSLAVSRDNWIALSNVGSALVTQGNTQEGLPIVLKALELKPDARLEGVLAVGLAKEGKTAEAIAAYRESVRLDPDLVEELNNLAWMLATDPNERNRNGLEAVQLAERACKLTQYENPQLIGTLAAAYAEAGRFEEAVRTGTEAYQRFAASGQKQMAEVNQRLLQLYQNRQPFHEQSQ